MHKPIKLTSSFRSKETIILAGENQKILRGISEQKPVRSFRVTD